MVTFLLFTLTVFEALLWGGGRVTEPPARDPPHRLSVDKQVMVDVTPRVHDNMQEKIGTTPQMHHNIQ